MYRPKKYIRLNQLPRMPRLADVKNLHEEGKKARSCTVELPWRTEKLGMTFSLTVRVDAGGGEPVWTLYEGEGNKSRVMWSTGFGDVDLLYDVLTLSLPADGPNIFAPQKEDPKPKPAIKVEPEPSYYDKEKYRNQPPAAEADAPYRPPFLDSEDMFLKPDPVPFESYSTREKDSAKAFDKDEFALPAVPEKSAYKAADKGAEKSAEPSAEKADQKSADKAAERPADRSATNPAATGTTSSTTHAPVTSDFLNPLAEPQVSLGGSHPQSGQDGQLQPPGYPPGAPGAPNPSLTTGGYPVPPGYPQQPGYPPPGYPPPGYPQQPGYPPPGYPPQPGYPGMSGQYPAIPYPGQPGYPGVSGQYPAAQYPQYPPYGQPPYLPPGADPLAPAGTVPLGPGMPGAPPDAYGGMPPGPGGVQRRPAIMLGTFLVEAGLVPKSTIDAALQVQVLVSQGSLSPVKAAEAVRRAHLRGGNLEPEEGVSATRPAEGGLRIKPQIGQVLVMAGIITAVQLKAALYLQDVIRSGTMSMEDAVELLKREALPAQVKSQTGDQIKSGAAEDFTRALALAKQAGLVTDSDFEAANKVKEKHGGEISKILVVAGKLDQLTLDGARTCQKYIDDGKIKVEQAIMALHYCQRMRVPFEEAATELGLDV